MPLDFDTIAASVVKTGRCIVMHEGPRTLGMGAEIAARVQEELFWNLEAPVLRATGFDTPYPPARLESDWLPGVDRLLDTVERSFVGLRPCLIPRRVVPFWCPIWARASRKPPSSSG